MTDRKEKTKWIKIAYSDRERGWAIDLGDGTARIANIPLTEGLNIDDVVRFDTTAVGALRVGAVLSSVFPLKVSVFYDNIGDFQAFRAAMHALGCKSEGYSTPTIERRGYAMVACKEGIDVYAIARKHGIRNPEIGDVDHTKLH